MIVMPSPYVSIYPCITERDGHISKWELYLNFGWLVWTMEFAVSWGTEVRRISRILRRDSAIPAKPISDFDVVVGETICWASRTRRYSFILKRASDLQAESAADSDCPVLSNGTPSKSP